MDTREIKLVDGIRQLYVPKLNEVSHTSPQGTRYWLLNSSNFIPSAVLQKDNFELALYDINEFLACWAKDIVRMTCASIETITGIVESNINKKFLAWQIIQYYYSAFYAAHASLKICGFGLIQLDKQTIQNIINRAKTLGISISPTDINKGIYCTNIDVAASKIIFYKVNKYDDSHRGLWKRYTDFIDVLCGYSVVTSQFNSNCIKIREISEDRPLSVYSQLPLTDAQIIVDRIEAVKNTINRHGDCNWLSWIRNSVNYSQAFGIWFPYAGFQSTYSELVSMKNLYLGGSLDQKLAYINEVDLSEFVKCCQIINAINYEIIVDLGSIPNSV